MATEGEEYSYLISVEDFDKSLLPPEARTPGTEAFDREVSSLLEREFHSFGGRVRIVVDASSISVTWHADPKGPDAVESVVRRLEQGQYALAIQMLEILRQRRPDDIGVLYNLGMTLSDVGRVEEAEQLLRHAVEIAPADANVRTALGVALLRRGQDSEAASVFRGALAAAPDNAWAHQNLAACLLRAGETAEAERHLRQAVELSPSDQKVLFGLGQALLALDRLSEADDLFVKVIELDSRTDIADAAKDERRKLAQQSFRKKAPGSVRPDAVMYCLDAIQKYGKMTREEVQRIAFEIAVFGQRGLDTNDSAQKYHLRSLPGQYSGLHLVCLMYAGFKILTPEADMGFDLSKEYEVAKSMSAKEGNAE